jgi:uncharacterized protein
MTGILLEGENVTEAERAAHARALSERNRRAAIARTAELKIRLGDAKLRAAERIEGTVLADHIVPAGQPFSLTVPAGARLRIIDLEGQQAVDFVCFDAANHANRYNAANTMKFAGSVFVGEGTRLFSELGDVLMTVTADTIGRHDTIAGCCSSEVNRLRYGILDTPSCRGNFLAELAKHGMGPADLPANLNFFMYVPVAPDGAMEIAEGRSEPGDFVDLAAERDVLCVLSNCPQVYNAANGWNPTPIRLILWRPASP